MKIKKAKAAEVKIESARLPTAIAQVSHPTLAGYTEQVHRVIDTLQLMRRRKYITEQGHLAGERYRHAHEVIYSQVGGSMDFDRVRGGGRPGAGPQTPYLLAAELISHAKIKLGPREYAIVHWVCAEGWNIDACARRIYQIKPEDKVLQCQRKKCGRYLREGLQILGDIWFPEPIGANSRLRTHRPFDSRPTLCEESDEIPRAQAVHATGQRIFGGQRAA